MKMLVGFAVMLIAAVLPETPLYMKLTLAVLFGVLGVYWAISGFLELISRRNDSKYLSKAEALLTREEPVVYPNWHNRPVRAPYFDLDEEVPFRKQ
jgi:hypothetical protein